MADNVEPEPPPPPPDDVTVTQPVTPIPADAPPPRQGCMEKRSGLEKLLLVLLIIILIICLGFVAAFIVFYFFASPPEGTCLSENCVQAASRLKSYMDDSVDPCNNFYEYACGGWLKTQALDPHESSIGVGSVIGDANQIKIKDLLERPKEPNEPVYKTQPKNFYAACMNKEKIDERGADPFFKVLKEVGKFPALDDSWNGTDFNLEDILIQLTKLSVMPLFSLDINRDLKSASNNKIYIADANLAMGSVSRYKTGRNDTHVRNYEKWLVENLVLLGADRQEAEEDMKNVVDLEIRIAKLMRSDIEKQDLSARYNPMTVAMLQSKYPWLQWEKFFQGLGSNPEGGNVYVGVEEVVINTEPLFLEKLGVVLRNTSTRVLTNHLMSRLLFLTTALSSDFVVLMDQFNKATRGTEAKPRWERCIDEATSVFSESVSRMYVEEFFSKDAKDYMNTMIDDLTVAFTELLKENDWMSQETKDKANAKLKLMGSKVGYPENIMDDERLNTLYKSIPSKQDEYMETLIAWKYYHFMKKIRKLREARDKETWPAHAATVNAYYDFLGNEIIFPAAFLQPPVYSPDYSSSMNYGGIGMVIGHEITHGYDNIGSQYDINGELKTWWTDADKESFNSRAECFVDQYGCYKWDGHSIDGQRTLAENIADNGGLKQSFRAYRNFINRQGSEEPRLPGLTKLSHNQIFFLSFAQVWCAKIRDEAKKVLVESDSHTPSPYRVYGTLQNSQDFAQAFGCKVGSRMNPMRKCVLW